MRIRDREVGPGSPPLIIAEIGINHGGDLKTAKQMVRSAVFAGAECIKHQTHFVEDEMTPEAHEIFPPNDPRSIWEVIASCALSREEEAELQYYTEQLGAIYISTPFSRSAADFLQDLDVPAFKIGSGECDNIPLLRHIAGFGKPIIMSTGMQSITSIVESVNILKSAGVDYALLECTNLYPSPPEFVSLKGISELRKAFPDAIIGFSDHSIGPTMAIASVALGASIVERHFTDSRYREGPDITASMDPAELRFLVDRSREVFAALRNEKTRTAPEEEVYRFARASIVSDRKLSAGHTISKEDIWARRPGTGEIPAREFDEVVGKVLKRNIDRNHQLRWEDFQ